MVSFATLFFCSIELPNTEAHAISFTYSPHSFPPFGFVTAESRDGIIVLSGVSKSAFPVLEVDVTCTGFPFASVPTVPHFALLNVTSQVLGSCTAITPSPTFAKLNHFVSGSGGASFLI